MGELESSPVERHIARRLKELRSQSGLTLEELARQSGVSRSMISLIERGMSSPTAAVLDKLAVSLGVTLPALFAQEKQADASPVSRRSDQQTWRDPATGYVRRNLSPSAFDSPIDLIEVTMPPLARVAYDSVARHSELHQQIWVLEGAIEVTVGHAKHRLSQGDCLAMVLDGPIVFRNSGRKESRHLVALMRPTRNSGYR